MLVLARRQFQTITVEGFGTVEAVAWSAALDQAWLCIRREDGTVRSSGIVNIGNERSGSDGRIRHKMLGAGYVDVYAIAIEKGYLKVGIDAPREVNIYRTERDDANGGANARQEALPGSRVA